MVAGKQPISEIPRWSALAVLLVVIVGFFPGHLLHLGTWADTDSDINLHRAIIHHVVSCYAQGRWDDILTVPWMAPYEDTLLLTETFLFPSILLVPLHPVIKNRVLLHDLVTALGWILSVLAAYLLGRKIGLSRLAALVVVLVVSANPIRLRYMQGFYIHVIFAFLFGLYYLFEYRQSRRLSALAAGLAIMLIPAHSSGYLFPIGTIAYLLILGWVMVEDRLWRKSGFWAVGLFFGAVLVFSYLPYAYLVQQTFADYYDYLRVKPLDFFLLLNAYVSNPFHLLFPYDASPLGRPDNNAYLGVIAVALAGLAVAPLFRRSGDPPPAAGQALAVLRRWLVLLTLAAIPTAFLVWNAYLTPIQNLRMDQVHSLAVGIVLWPLILRLLVTDTMRGFYRRHADERFVWVLLILLIFFLVGGSDFSILRDKATKLLRAVALNPIGYAFSRLPGVDAMRSLPRTVVFLFVGLGVLAGLGLDAIQRKVKRPRALGLAMVCLLFLDVVPPWFVDGWNLNRQVPEVRQAYRYLDQQPPGELFVELPMPDYRAPGGFGWQVPAVFSTLHHGQRLLSGYSGHATAHGFAYSKLYSARRFDEFFSALEAGGTRYIVSGKHRPGYPLADPPTPPPPWRLVWEQGDERVYGQPNPRVQMLGDHVFRHLKFRLPEGAKSSREVEAFLDLPAPAWFLTQHSRHLFLDWVFETGTGQAVKTSTRVFLQANLYSRDLVDRLEIPFGESTLRNGGRLIVTERDDGVLGDLAVSPW